MSEAEKLVKLQVDTISINMLIGDEDTEFGNFIEADTKKPEDEVIDDSLAESLYELLEKCNLTERKIIVLTNRYGLNNSEEKTLDEIGKMYGITRERVRQIEAKAIMKIRRSKYIKALSIYMNSPTKAEQRIDEYRKKYSTGTNSNKKFSELEERNEEKVAKKLQTIYEYFDSFTREEVNEMLKN